MKPKYEIAIYNENCRLAGNRSCKDDDLEAAREGEGDCHLEVGTEDELIAEARRLEGTGTMYNWKCAQAIREALEYGHANSLR